MDKVAPGYDLQTSTRKEVKRHLFALWKEGSWDESLLWWRRLVDVYAEDPERTEKFEMLTWTQRPSEEKKLEVLVKGDNASDLYYIGRTQAPHFYTEYEEHKHLAFEYFDKAASLGHACAMRMMAGIIEMEDPVRGLEMMTRAAEMGCGTAAYIAASKAYRRSDCYEGGRLDALGTMAEYEASKTRLHVYRETNSSEVAPFGEWEPRRVVQIRVPNRLHGAMVTACLIFGARSHLWLPIYVRNLIAFYICTKNGWYPPDGWDSYAKRIFSR